MTCRMKGCKEPVHGRGLCNTHYHRWRRHGDPGIVLPGRGPTKHGHARRRGGKTSTYRSWAAMIRRCGNRRHPDYGNYGARGIQVCPAWRRFEAFLADMGERPEGKTLDRIDNEGDYTPGNCRWATAKEQAQNRRPRIQPPLNERDPQTGLFIGKPA